MALKKPPKQRLWETLLSLPNLSTPAAAKVQKLTEEVRQRIPPSVECLWNDFSTSMTNQHSSYSHLNNNNTPKSVTSSQHGTGAVSPDFSDSSPFAYDNRAMIQELNQPIYANLELRPSQATEPEVVVIRSETPIYAIPNQPVYANLPLVRPASSIPDTFAPGYTPYIRQTEGCQAHCICGGTPSASPTHPDVHQVGKSPRISKKIRPGLIDGSKKVSFTKPSAVTPVDSGKLFQKATEQVFCENCTCFLDPVELTDNYSYSFETAGISELCSTDPSPNANPKNKLNLRIDTKSANRGPKVCLTDPVYDFIMNSPVVKKLREYGFTYPGEDELRRRRLLHCAIFCLVLIVILLIVLNVVVPHIVRMKPLEHRMGFPIETETKPSELYQKNGAFPVINPNFVNSRHNIDQKFYVPTSPKAFKPVVQLITAPPLKVQTGVTVVGGRQTTTQKSAEIGKNRPEIETEIVPIDPHPVIAGVQSTQLPESTTISQTTDTKTETTERVEIFFPHFPTTESPSTTTEGLPEATTEASSKISYSTWLPSHPPNATCEPNQFKCTAGVSSVPCLYQWRKCDGVQDCSDGSDEMFCDKLNCYGNFRCDSGACVSLEKVCNGIPDCADKSDELVCDTYECKQYEHRCNSGYCIPKVWVCDGESDCPDHGDEYACSKSCAKDQFMCPEGWCIPDSWVCNGISDCAGAEDEQNCRCAVDQFSCANGGCADKKYVCDGVQNCADGSDEWDCAASERIVKIRDAVNEQWLPVCADKWTSEHSNRICRQLGYRKAVEHAKLPLSVLGLTSAEVFRLSDAVPPVQSDSTKLQFLVRKRPVSACQTQRAVKVFCETFDCGLWHPSTELSSRAKRVVGGHVSGKHQWPSMVVMIHTQKYLACSASIISPFWAITSALCIRRTDSNAANWKIVAGNGQPNASDPEMLTRLIRKFVRHPSYKFKTILSDFDVMLVRLQKPLDLTSGEPSPSGTKSRVGAICLPRQPTHTEAWCVTAGWGYTTPGGYYINKQLRHLEMNIWTKDACNSSDHYRGMLTDRMLCARNDHSEPCYNDEGGPLMCHDPAYGRWYLAGVMTSHSCDSLRHPAIFADIFQMNDWIRNTISS